MLGNFSLNTRVFLKRDTWLNAHFVFWTRAYPDSHENSLTLLNHNTMTGVENVSQLLRNHHVAVDLSKSKTQSLYLHKLQSDLERTEQFLGQAERAILELKKEQKAAEEENESTTWSMSDESRTRKVHLLALHEVYKQLPYLASKNDLIGIATAATITTNAVKEQSKASKCLGTQNAQELRDVESLEEILMDYQELNKILRQRIQCHPQKMAQLEESISDLGSLTRKTHTKIELSRQVNNAVKNVEDTLYSHVQRLVVKLHAMMDWESTSVADEQTFRNNIIRSSTFVKTLVERLVESDDPWVQVVEGSPEDHLAKLLVQHDIVRLAEGQKDKVSLRNYDE